MATCPRKMSVDSSDSKLSIDDPVSFETKLSNQQMQNCIYDADRKYIALGNRRKIVRILNICADVCKADPEKLAAINNLIVTLSKSSAQLPHVDAATKSSIKKLMQELISELFADSPDITLLLQADLESAQKIIYHRLVSESQLIPSVWSLCKNLGCFRFQPRPPTLILFGTGTTDAFWAALKTEWQALVDPPCTFEQLCSSRVFEHQGGLEFPKGSFDNGCAGTPFSWDMVDQNSLTDIPARIERPHGTMTKAVMMRKIV